MSENALPSLLFGRAVLLIVLLYICIREAFESFKFYHYVEYNVEASSL